MTQQNIVDLHRHTTGRALRIVRVVPPTPSDAPGSYEVDLELSRQLTTFEDQALHRLARGMHAVGHVLTVHDTTLERIAGDAAQLTELVHRVEREGRRLEQEAARRSRDFVAAREQRAARMADLAASIDFTG